MSFVRILFIISIIEFISMGVLPAQTCCTGGIPIAGNLAFENNGPNVWQVGSMFDFNDLSTLKNQNLQFDDQSSERKVYSFLLRTGYNITQNLVVGSIIPLVRQERKTTYKNGTDFTYTQGLGDVIFFSQYKLPVGSRNNNYQVGIGSKFPTGTASLTSRNGISYSMDMQPGSGSLDFLFWGSYEHSFSKIPSMTIFTQLFYRLNGTYDNYLGNESYHFGNEWQFIPGISKQWLIASQIINTSVLFKIKNMEPNEINNYEIANTGGLWTYIIPSITYQITRSINVSIAPEIPVYSKVNGTQLTTSYRIRAGININVNRKVKMNKDVELKLE